MDDTYLTIKPKQNIDNCTPLRIRPLIGSNLNLLALDFFLNSGNVNIAHLCSCPVQGSAFKYRSVHFGARIKAPINPQMEG